MVMKRAKISWKGDQLVQHAFLQQCPHVSAMIKGDLSSLLASSLQCFASRWTLGYIWKIRGHYMPLWKRSTPKNWHLTKNHVGKWWIPLQKLTWQRKITIFCLKMRYIFQRLTCPLSCWFSEGTFHWWMKSPWWNPSDEVCQVGWRKWSYVRQLLSARAYPDWGGCGWMFWWKKWFWDMISVKMFFWICESLTRLYVLDFVLCNTW